MIQIAIGGRGQLEGAEADIVKGFVVNTESFVRIFDKLVDGQRGIVRFDDCVTNLEWATPSKDEISIKINI